jgi:hypothetical protein
MKKFSRSTIVSRVECGHSRSSIAGVLSFGGEYEEAHGTRFGFWHARASRIGVCAGPGIFPNLNADDPTKWLYSPDTSRQAQGAESYQIATLRLTWQASPRHKFNFHWDEQLPCNGATYGTTQEGCRQQPESGAVIGTLGLGGLSGTTSPEIANYLHMFQRVQQITWSSPLTNRVLLEGGFGTLGVRWGPFDMPGNPTRPLVRMQEQCAGGCALNGGIPNLIYRSANWGNHWNGTNTWRGSASYVTGSHNMKFGPAQPDHQSCGAGPGLGRSGQRDRPSYRKGPAVRPHTDARWSGHLQRRQCGARSDLQPDVRAEHLVAGAVVSADAAICEGERADRVLESSVFSLSVARTL